MHKKIILTTSILLLSFTISAQNWFGGAKKIKGNGNITSISKNVSNFKGIMSGGSFNVILEKGTTEKVVIKGEENIIKLIETEIDNDILKINFKKNINISNSKQITITVTYLEIDSVFLAGSGSVTSKDNFTSDTFNVNIGGSGSIRLSINTDAVKANIGGSGNIYLKGKTNKITASVAGSGNIKAYQLVTNKAKGNIAGSGNIEVTVNNKIEANLIGSGNIFYKGNPADVESTTIGSGSIIDKN
ncbi:head GIN domain-containing protein [Polaribacter tangerinus]|uniref:head GIN domain-containing protein n=1 Tax=Polaribacter tangerinus TaxID=1920034 RepID=UPI000B4AEF6F|nr:head GIN domain-containing protein [Polaribacter tangerinus]